MNKLSAKKNKELRRRRPPVGTMLVSSARPHKPTKYNGDGSLNKDFARLQELKAMLTTPSRKGTD